MQSLLQSLRRLGSPLQSYLTGLFVGAATTLLILNLSFVWQLPLVGATVLKTMLFPSFQPTLQVSSTAKGWYKDLQATYLEMLEREGIPAALAQLEADTNTDSRVASLCHDILHSLGQRAYQTETDLPAALQYQSEFCNSGYLHGVFEAYFQADSFARNDLTQLCTTTAPTSTALFQWQCEHGIGHGLMYLTAGDLDTTLEICTEQLDEVGATNCYNGAYMELFNMEYLPRENQFIDADDPFATCRERNIGKAECHLYIATFFAQTGGVAYADIVDYCSQAELGYEALCLAGLGSEVMKRNYTQPQKAIDFCSNLEQERKQTACLEGAVVTYVTQTGSLPDSQTFCAELEAPLKSQCQATLSSLSYLTN